MVSVALSAYPPRLFRRFQNKIYIYIDVTPIKTQKLLQCNDSTNCLFFVLENHFGLCFLMLSFVLLGFYEISHAVFIKSLTMSY